MKKRLPKFEFKFEKYKWGVHVHLIHFNWKKPLRKTKINVIFYLTISYARRLEMLSNKKWFTFAIAAFERNIKEGSWIAKGFRVLFEKL